jgi:hypothetical protein
MVSRERELGSRLWFPARHTGARNIRENYRLVAHHLR